MKKQILIILLVLLAGTVVGAERTIELKAEIVVNADTGWPSRLIISGFNPNNEAWLGMSLYPFGMTDPIVGGRHSFVELKKGKFRHEIIVDQALLGGSFEIGLWGKRVSKVDCTLDYCYWCKMHGYHVEESLAYKSGLFTQLNGYK